MVRRMTRLVGQVAFVTGAGSGIGRAIALRLAAEGARVAVADINADGARLTVEQIQGAGGEGVAVSADVANFDSVKAAVAEAKGKLGPISILVNNAGWDRVEPFLKNTPETWAKVIDINLKGTIHCTRAVLDDMIAAGRGKIVSIGSDAGRVGSTGEAVYAGCKGGIIAFSKTMAREMARNKINVNVVCPGPTKTALLEDIIKGEQGAKLMDAITRSIPFRRLGEPEDITGAVAFFASSDADFVTGQVLSVSGGLTMAG